MQYNGFMGAAALSPSNIEMKPPFSEEKGLTFNEILEIQRALAKRSQTDTLIKGLAKAAEEISESGDD